MRTGRQAYLVSQEVGRDGAKLHTSNNPLVKTTSQDRSPGTYRSPPRLHVLNVPSSLSRATLRIKPFGVTF